MKKCLGRVVVYAAVILITGSFIVWAVHNNTSYIERQYSLLEVEPSIYGIYNTVSSRVPAENYAMITLNCDGKIMTLKGCVDIIYITDDPYVKVKDYNLVNGDKISVFVPSGSIKFQENIGV